MSFQFPLSAALRYRESLEQREHLALEKRQQEIVRVEMRMREVDDDCSTAMQNRAAKLAQGIRAAEVQFAYEYLRALEQQREALRLLLQDAKMKWRQQLDYYQLARRNRETLEILRENQLNAYNRERAKREQAVLDDIFLARRGRSN
jgi:flagellar export protein FliJ